VLDTLVQSREPPVGRVRAMFSDKIISRMGGRSLGAVPC